MNTQDILANSDNISLTSVADAEGKFCQLWPSVKEGLQLLVGLIKNPVVKYTISGIIAAGDAVASKICGK